MSSERCEKNTPRATDTTSSQSSGRFEREKRPPAACTFATRRAESMRGRESKQGILTERPLRSDAARPSPLGLWRGRGAVGAGRAAQRHRLSRSWRSRDTLSSSGPTVIARIRSVSASSSARSGRAARVGMSCPGGYSRSGSCVPMIVSQLDLVRSHDIVPGAPAPLAARAGVNRDPVPTAENRAVTRHVGT